MPALLSVPQKEFGYKVSLVSYSYVLVNGKSQQADMLYQP